MSAIRRLAELTFDHHQADPDFVRLVSIENIHRGEHIKGRRTRPPQQPGDRADRRDPRARPGSRRFVRDVDALDVHMMISAFCVFRVANRYTSASSSAATSPSPDRRDHYRQMLSDMVVTYSADPSVDKSSQRGPPGGR